MTFQLLILFDFTPSCPVQPLAATTTLWRTTVPPWHSSALSLMDSLRVCSSYARSAQAQHSRQLLSHALGFLSSTLRGYIPRPWSHRSW
jgi:hypothetical protein